MKELTVIATVEITEIKKLSDEEYDFIVNHTDKAKKNVQQKIRDIFFKSDDVHTKVQCFVRDSNDET